MPGAIAPPVGQDGAIPHRRPSSETAERGQCLEMGFCPAGRPKSNATAPECWHARQTGQTPDKPLASIARWSGHGLARGRNLLERKNIRQDAPQPQYHLDQCFARTATANVRAAIGALTGQSAGSFKTTSSRPTNHRKFAERFGPALCKNLAQTAQNPGLPRPAACIAPMASLRQAAHLK